MNKSKIILEIFKEFYSIPQDATYKLKDVSYRKSVISEEDLEKDEFNNKMVS